MSAVACPSCNKALPASVVSGPAQAVVRCEGCQTLLLWSNGRVMRSAKSSTPTMMGMPAVGGGAVPPKTPAARDAELPLPELRPEADAAPQPPAGKTTLAGRPAPALGKTPPRTATQPIARVTPPPKTMPAAKAAPSGPIKTAPSGPIKTGAAPSAPSKSAPSGPVKLPPAAAPAPANSDAGKDSPHVVAAVAQVPQMGGGDMVDPSAWFKGDVSDVVAPDKLPPIEGSKPARSDTTGAQPLPPPPSLAPLEAEPFEIEAPGEEKTPAAGVLLPEKRVPPATAAPSAQPAKKTAASIRGAEPQVPAPSRPMADLPSAGTAIGKAPSPSPSAPSPRATVMGRPALETPKPAEPVAAAVTMLPTLTATPVPATKPGTTPPPSKSAPAASAPAASAPTNVPEAVTQREVSAEMLPPPPSTTPSGTEATRETALPPQPETSRVPRETPRRTLFLFGGGAVGVVALVLVVLALSRGTPSTKPAARTTPVAATPAPVAAKPTTQPPAPKPTEAPAATPPAEPPNEAAAAPSPPRPRRTLGGKKVVLEYDPKPTSPTPPPPQAPTPMGEDPATVARAREAYHKGNVKLFAGDDTGAIDLYRQSLKIYPGYVAGYRGLGLAFEEAGKKEDALAAFHTYVRTVPNAVDAAIIRRRIEHLESLK